MVTYRQSLEFLFPRTTTIKFGLETTRALLGALGDPHTTYPCLHIGGTNGKGSVSTMCAEALRAAGWRVGLYTSPHLVSFRERIVVDGQPISEEAVAAWTGQLRPLIEERQATFFEASTAIAFADFAARRVDIAVIEVGMGGRLDSTNVVHPLVSAVTKVELDHMKYLGETREAIAGEKAWIAKPGAPFVIGETRPALIEVLREVGQEAVRAVESRAELDARVVPPEARYAGPLRLLGTHQRRNAAVAQAVLDALPAAWRPDAAAVREGFARAFIPGRLDRRGRWLFDVAHNPDGMRTLVGALGELQVPRPVHALVSILGDKEWPEMLVELDRGIDRGILTLAPTAAARGWDMDWLQRWLASADRPPARAQWTLVRDFGEAISEVQRGAGTCLVTGSFHTVGDVLEALGMGVG